jgi:hypothetical protein
VDELRAGDICAAGRWTARGLFTASMAAFAQQTCVVLGAAGGADASTAAGGAPRGEEGARGLHGEHRGGLGGGAKHQAEERKR